MKTKKDTYLVGFVLLLMLGALLVPYVEQQAAADLLANPVTWIVVLVIFFILLSIAAVTEALNSIKYFVLRREGRLHELPQEEAETLQDDFFTRLWKRMQDAKPIERESEIELDHEYDGIRELDNNLPPWWLWGFYISIAFAVIYIFRFHILGTAPLSAEEYQEQLVQAEIQKAEYLKNAANLVDESNVVMLEDEALLAEGGKIFAKNCAVCHAADGGGGVGPNLTDIYWIHGGDIKDVFATVKYGVPAKGMIPWKDQLNPSEMQKVSSYILSLQGTSPANPKEAQGDAYEAPAEEEAGTLSADSLTAEPADTTTIDTTEEK